MTQVKSCPRCGQLMWLKDDQFEILDASTIRARCPHCQELVRLKLTAQGANATGPKMGH